MIVLEYIKKVEYRNVIGLPTICGYKNCGDKKEFNVRDMFSQFYF